MDTIIKATKTYEIEKGAHELRQADFRKHIGSHLRELRQRAKLTITGMARQLEISRTYLYDIETGRKIMSEKLLERLKNLKLK